MRKITKQKKSTWGEGNRSPKTDTPSPINFSWLEIVPMLILLIFVAGILGFGETFDYNPHIIREKVELDNMFNNSTVELP